MGEEHAGADDRHLGADVVLGFLLNLKGLAAPLGDMVIQNYRWERNTLGQMIDIPARMFVLGFLLNLIFYTTRYSFRRGKSTDQI
jgi:hypothetical protein